MQYRGSILEVRMNHLQVEMEEVMKMKQIDKYSSGHKGKGDQVMPGMCGTARKRYVRHIAAEGGKNKDGNESGDESKSNDKNESSNTEGEQEINQVICDHVWPGTREKARKRNYRHTTVEGGTYNDEGMGCSDMYKDEGAGQGVMYKYRGTKRQRRNKAEGMGRSGKYEGEGTGRNKDKMNKDEGMGRSEMYQDEGVGWHKRNKAETEDTKYKARNKQDIISQAENKGTKHKAGTKPIVILKAESEDTKNGNIPAKIKKMGKEDTAEMNKDEGRGAARCSRARARGGTR